MLALRLNLEGEYKDDLAQGCTNSGTAGKVNQYILV